MIAAKSQSPKSAKDKLQDAIRSLGTTMGLNNAFTKFLELTATALGAVLDPVNAKERNQQYEDAQKGLKPDEISEFARMTALMWLSVLEYKEEPEDILGDIYHSLRLNNEWNGQFFTPDHVARLMAKLSNPVSESGSDEGYVTINDKTTPRLIQFHTFKNAVNPPFLGGFSIFSTVAAWAERHPCQ